MIGEGREWTEYQGPINIDGYWNFKEQGSAPATPRANYLRVYAKDKSGTSALFLKDDAGNEREIAPANTVSGSGANGRVTFWTGAATLSSNANFFWDNTNLRLGIGTGAPLDSLHVQKSGASATHNILISTYATSPNNRSIFATQTARGTSASPADQGAGDSILELIAAGYSGGAFRNVASVQLKNAASGTISASSQPTVIGMSVTADGSVSRTERFLLSGNSVDSAILVVGGGTGGLSGVTAIDLIGITSTASAIVRQTAAGTSNFCNFQGRHSRGTTSAPTATQADDLITRLSAIQYGATGYTAGARAAIDLVAAENASDTAQGTYIKFQTTAKGATTLTERARILASGHWRSEEFTTDPGTGDLSSLAQMAVYMKNNKFVIAYNNGGTITYITIPMDGSTTTWTHNTTAP